VLVVPTFPTTPPLAALLDIAPVVAPLVVVLELLITGDDTTVLAVEAVVLVVTVDAGGVIATPANEPGGRPTLPPATHAAYAVAMSAGAVVGVLVVVAVLPVVLAAGVLPVAGGVDTALFFMYHS